MTRASCFNQCPPTQACDTMIIFCTLAGRFIAEASHYHFVDLVTISPATNYAAATITATPTTTTTTRVVASAIATSASAVTFGSTSTGVLHFQCQVWTGSMCRPNFTPSY